MNDGMIRGNDQVQNNFLQQASDVNKRLEALEKIVLTSSSAALKYEPLNTVEQRRAQAWMAMHTMPLLFPHVRGVWLMNQWAAGLMCDATSQGRHMTTHGTLAFAQQNTILRYLAFDGTSTYLSRASEAGLEITDSLSLMGWFYKTTAGTQFPILSKTNSLSSGATQAWLFTVGSSDNLNLTVCSGSTGVVVTTPVPVGEWVFGAAAYSPSAFLRVYSGTRDGWDVGENTTSIPASINNPTTIDLTIGAIHGGAAFAGGNFAMAALMNSISNETLFRTVFDFTKDILYT